MCVVDINIGPCLWIGTELGSVLVLTFQLPSTGFPASTSTAASSTDPSPQAHRLSQPVIGLPTGQSVRPSFLSFVTHCNDASFCRNALSIQ